MRLAHTREPPVPPELIERRRLNKSLGSRTPSHESFRTESDASGDMSWSNVLSYSTDGSVELDTGQRERKNGRGMKRHASMGRGRGGRIRNPDVAFTRCREDGRYAGDKTPTPSVSGGIGSDLQL